MKLNNKGIP